MKPNKPLNFFLVIIAAILSSALYRQFDAENMTFEKPALSALYGIVLIVPVYLMIKAYRKPPEKK